MECSVSTRSKQSWEVGQTVKVGFLSLKVTEKVPTPGDSMPDLYKLTSLDGTKQYEFQPYYGLTRL